jgi:1-acyl-sn-glycerol-3-phosphate acyltransferase
MTSLEREVPGYQNGNRIVRRGSEIAAHLLTRKSFSRESKDHLEEAVTLWQEGKEAWIASKHESDVDGPLVGVGLRCGGHPEFSDSMFILMGDKILKKRWKGLVARSYPHVVVPQVGSGNGKTRELLSSASIAIPKLLEKHKVAFIFPEGTRSRDGVLGNASPAIAHYLAREAFVLPMAIEGARNVWPVEGKPRPFREITFHFGKPILIADVMAEIDFYEQSLGQRINKVGRNRIIIDAIMRHGIAPLIPIEQRGEYANPDFSICDILQKSAKRVNLVV